MVKRYLGLGALTATVVATVILVFGQLPFEKGAIAQPTEREGRLGPPMSVEVGDRVRFAAFNAGLMGVVTGRFSVLDAVTGGVIATSDAISMAPRSGAVFDVLISGDNVPAENEIIPVVIALGVLQQQSLGVISLSTEVRDEQGRTRSFHVWDDLGSAVR